MKNFNKKAIFAALMGALSSVSSFAAENNNKNLEKRSETLNYQKEQEYRTIDNANLFQHKDISQDKRIMFLDKNDPNLNLSQDELYKIFKQMAEVEYISFYDGGMIETRRQLEDNFEQFVKTKKIPVRVSETFVISNPKLYEKMNKQNMSEIDQICKELLTNYKKSRCKKKYLLHYDNNNSIDGFIQYELGKNDAAIYINVLATNKISSGIGGAMIKKMKQKFNYLKLIPTDDTAANFYKHLGFNQTLDGTWVWKTQK